MGKEEFLLRRKYRKERVISFFKKGEQVVHTLWYFFWETGGNSELHNEEEMATSGGRMEMTQQGRISRQTTNISQ